MGADIKSLRSRIRSVDSTLHLTRAMGLVASSKIRRATRNMNQSRQYAAAMEDLLKVLRAAPECERSPYMKPAGQGTRIIVIAGDRGLAGGYNANVFRLAATEPEAERRDSSGRFLAKLLPEYLEEEPFLKTILQPAFRPFLL